MKSGTQARADWRALVSAAFIGWSVGLSLGVAYLATGMGQAALDHSRAARIADATAGGLSQKALAGFDAGVAAPGAPQAAFAESAGRAAASLAAVDPDARRIIQDAPSPARELDCLTQAVYFEARGESARGQQAVATVIMNRVKSAKFPKTVCEVVYQGAGRRHGCQFSFACDGRAERVVEHSAWTRARQVAARALSGAVLRDVGSATHFHTTAVAPQWGPRMLRTAQVGLHVFYRFNPRAPRPRVEEPAEAPVFASAPATPKEIRLAAAVLAPAAEDVARPAAEIQAAPAAPVRLEAEKPAPKANAKAEPAHAPAPIARAEPSPVVKLDLPAAS